MMLSLKICRIFACTKNVHARELCPMHYQQARKAGDLPKRLSMPERFWAKVDKNGPILKPDLGPCWVWTGATRHGYGAFHVDAEHPSQQAHRVAWLLEHGKFPTDGLDHRCSNPPCVRTFHLRDADQVLNGENLQTGQRGSTSPHRGVSFCPATGRWKAQVRHQGVSYWCGRHNTEQQAAEAARLKRVELMTYNDADRQWTS